MMAPTTAKPPITPPTIAPMFVDPPIFDAAAAEVDGASVDVGDDVAGDVEGVVVAAGTMVDMVLELMCMLDVDGESEIVLTGFESLMLASSNQSFGYTNLQRGIVDNK